MSTARLPRNRSGAFKTSMRTGGALSGRSNVSFRGARQVYDNIVDAHNSACDNCGNECVKAARRLAFEARNNARWKDRSNRTGSGRHARASIVGRTSHHAFTTSIIVKGGEGVYEMRKGSKRPYYHYLEAAMNQKYATIKPTVNSRASEVIRDIGSSMLRGVRQRAQP